MNNPVPTTDEEAMQALSFYQDPMVRDSVQRIFQCRRAMGDELLDAYMYALRAFLGELPKEVK